MPPKPKLENGIADCQVFEDDVCVTSLAAQLAVEAHECFPGVFIDNTAHH